MSAVNQIFDPELRWKKGKPVAFGRACCIKERLPTLRATEPATLSNLFGGCHGT